MCQQVYTRRAVMCLCLGIIGGRPISLSFATTKKRLSALGPQARRKGRGVQFPCDTPNVKASLCCIFAVAAYRLARARFWYNLFADGPPSALSAHHHDDEVRLGGAAQQAELPAPDDPQVAAQAVVRHGRPERRVGRLRDKRKERGGAYSARISHRFRIQSIVVKKNLTLQCCGFGGKNKHALTQSHR